MQRPKKKTKQNIKLCYAVDGNHKTNHPYPPSDSHSSPHDPDKGSKATLNDSGLDQTIE